MADLTTPQPSVQKPAWFEIAPALRSRNFQLFWSGQFLSNIGTALQVVAEGWLIYNLTNSTFWLGMVGFLGLLPVVPVSLLGGVLIDRVPRRKLILITQIGLLGQAAIFGILGTTGQIKLWHVIFLYFVFGALLAIDHPARRAFLVELVGPDDLANAVALNATIFNFSSLVGYAAGGVLIATIGAGGTMLINSATYLFPIWALMMIRVVDVGRDLSRPALGVAVSEGAVALLKQPAILGTIGLMAVVGGLVWPVYGLMPAFVEEVLDVGSIGLGILLAVGALGSLIGTVLVARLGVHHRGLSIIIVSLLLPLLVVAFAASPNIWIACLILLPLGVGLLVLQSLAITLVQINIADRVRGRVMSLYSMLHAGSDTMGNVVIGSGAVFVGLPWALSLGAIAALFFVLVTWLLLPAIGRLD